MEIEKKRKQEKQVIETMIHCYCRHTHHEKELCPQCLALLAYAHQRIDACPFMAEKTFCSNCKIHCYAPEKREQIKAVMRKCGPRMLFTNPLLLFKHILASKKEK